MDITGAVLTLADQFIEHCHVVEEEHTLRVMEGNSTMSLLHKLFTPAKDMQSVWLGVSRFRRR